MSHSICYPGVTNAQLVKEGAAVAVKYDNRSVAEQNSFVLAWNLFMSERFGTLRQYLCATPAEIVHFRELAVNAVMATDIVDKDLKNLRNIRWKKAFKNQYTNIEELDSEGRESINRKATIVIEHLIQASDVSHTMQHWQYVPYLLPFLHLIHLFLIPHNCFVVLQCVPKVERAFVS